MKKSIMFAVATAGLVTVSATSSMASLDGYCTKIAQVAMTQENIKSDYPQCNAPMVGGIEWVGSQQAYYNLCLQAGSTDDVDRVLNARSTYLTQCSGTNVQTPNIDGDGLIVSSNAKVRKCESLAVRLTGQDNIMRGKGCDTTATQNELFWNQTEVGYRDACIDYPPAKVSEIFSARNKIVDKCLDK